MHYEFDVQQNLQSYLSVFDRQGCIRWRNEEMGERMFSRIVFLTFIGGAMIGCGGSSGGQSNSFNSGVSSKTADDIAACSAGISVTNKAEFSANLQKMLSGSAGVSAEVAAEVKGLFLNSGLVRDDNALKAYEIFIGCIQNR